MPAIIRCDRLCKRFGTIQALDGLSFQIAAKASAGLVGPNGAGKTTLLSLLCGFTLPSSGSIEVLGKRPGSGRLLGRIGFLPQDVALFRGIPVYKQLLFFARLQGLDKKMATREVNRVISQTGIHAFTRQYPETLSQGQRKKAALAQALIGQPSIILLDEPTAGLDPVAANQVRDIIQGLRNQNTLLISSHNLDEIKNICNEIVIIDRGRLIKHCLINELIESHNTFTILIDAPATELILKSIESLPSVTGVRIDNTDNTRLSVIFQGRTQDQMQISVLEVLRSKGVTVLEFRFGGDFSDRVIQLVSGQ